MPQILGKEAGPIGLGLMGLTWRAEPPSQEQAFATLRAALKNGCNVWNGGEFYGPPEYNSSVLLERYFEKYPEDADKVILSIKGGMNPETHAFDGSIKNTRRTLDDSIAPLKGRKRIDLFEFARRDQNVPMEDTFGTMDKEYIQTGKIGGISLSEVRAETIHEAVKKGFKVHAVEAEVSLFSTEILDNGVAAACAQYGIPIIAYSPMGRGILSGQFRKYEDVPEDSIIKNFPRFQRGNFEANLKLLDQLEEMSNKKGCTPAQFAINWVRALARRPGMPTIIPIPGATTAERVEENSKLIDISDDEMERIDNILAQFVAAGDRYPAAVASNT